MRTKRSSSNGFFCSWYRDAGVDVFLQRRGDVEVGGRDGPWTGADSVSLSPPKLVINSTTGGADEPGDLERDRDDDILRRTPSTPVLCDVTFVR